ncbi:hypothetical protein PN36_06285 [Candidatus Thiomargarita nelsonii]|uniref:Uncharacterized protein n=1 Tax=Candidatus Thiomargarita nelsonii TaxID=1003181 RepID=A0A0A6RRI5_9GAMM|nr:hypothetical protein PN36_06285 [Candidatus Thiomargarita nelsonii]
MQAIEFTSQLQDGMIPIPKPYKDWSKKPVRVILLTQELPHHMPNSPIEANAWLGCMSGQILGDIVSPIDDNLISWDVLA